MNRAEALRRAFDAEFARATAPAAADDVDFLAIRIAGDPFAIRLAEVSALYADRPIARVPARAPALLGLVGVRGAIVPVFDLGACLGYPPAAAPRWIVTAGPLGFAFEGLDGHARGAATTGDMIELGPQLRSIVRLTAVIEALVDKES